jgi:hypothetical protein
MSANVYTQHFVDKPPELRRRRIRQGRTPKPEKLKMIRTNITTSREAKKVIKGKAKSFGMSFSAYVELACILYTPELLNP